MLKTCCATSASYRVLSVSLRISRSHYMPLTWICQLRAAIKWSRSIKDASRKQEKILSRLRMRDFRDRMTISIHVRPPMVACVTLSNTARSNSFLPYFRSKSPRIEQAPIAHVRITRDQSSRPYIAQASSREICRRRSCRRRLRLIAEPCLTKDFKSRELKRF